MLRPFIAGIEPGTLGSGSALPVTGGVTYVDSVNSVNYQDRGAATGFKEDLALVLLLKPIF